MFVFVCILLIERKQKRCVLKEDDTNKYKEISYIV